jgi:hypothetical protein
VAGCCECGDEPSGSCATELVSLNLIQHFCNWNDSGIILKPPISFHGGQKYVEVHL